jgi:hypothetical protein
LQRAQTAQASRRVTRFYEKRPWQTTVWKRVDFVKNSVDAVLK